MVTSLGLLVGGFGVLLVWSAIVNVSPVDELRAALTTGQGVRPAGKGGGPSGASLAGKAGAGSTATAPAGAAPGNGGGGSW